MIKWSKRPHSLFGTENCGSILKGLHKKPAIEEMELKSDEVIGDETEVRQCRKGYLEKCVRITVICQTGTLKGMLCKELKIFLSWAGDTVSFCYFSNDQMQNQIVYFW